MFALVKDGSVIRTTNEQSIDWEGFTYSNIFLLTSDERKAVGIFDFVTEPMNAPEGKKAQGTTVSIGDGVVTESHIYVDKTTEELAAEKAALFKTYEDALDVHLDSVAQGFRFKDRHSLAIRAGYVNRYQALASAFGTWMESCNDVAYQGLQDVMDGKRTLPTIEEMILELPVWVAP